MRQGSPSGPAVAALTALALLFFAANSLAARLALAGHPGNDPVAFTALRLVAGAAVLAVLAGPGRARRGGTLVGALALMGYAFGFALAYVRIGAATGALLLFGAVQATMLATGLWQGERASGRLILGLLGALGGIGWLMAPGARAPDLLGAAAMTGAGVAWGAYSLWGRRAADALGATAGNFLFTVPVAAGAWLLALRAGGGRLSPEGAGLATFSGALTSGVGYAAWYTVVPRLGALRAGLVQLLVPVLTAFSAVPLLGEVVSLRLVGAGALTLGGVALALSRGLRPAVRAPAGSDRAR